MSNLRNRVNELIDVAEEMLDADIDFASASLDKAYTLLFETPESFRDPSYRAAVGIYEKRTLPLYEDLNVRELSDGRGIL